jgi:hypothetical protein
LKSGKRTLPLCFSSFELLKQNVCNVSSQKSSRHDERSKLASGDYLPLCFSSFEWLKENHDVIEETWKFDCIHSSTASHEEIVISKEDQQHPHALNDHVVDYLKGYSNSELQPVLNHQIKEEADQKIVVKSHFPSPETNVDVQQYFQQDKVFQSCLSSLENDVVILFLSSLDMDKDFETASMETPSSEKHL